MSDETIISDSVIDALIAGRPVHELRVQIHDEGETCTVTAPPEFWLYVRAALVLAAQVVPGNSLAGTFRGAFRVLAGEDTE